MKIIDVKLDTVCGYTSTLPVFDEPEIAFAGKSNVGKSSLINAVMKRRRLARVGETPGKTRTINFYHVVAEVPQVPEQGIVNAPALQQSMEDAAGDAGSLQAEAIRKKKLRWKKDPSRQKALSGKNGQARVRGSQKEDASQTAVRVPTERKPFFLVDLPGYGYANVSVSEKEKWGEMIERYLNSSPGLKKVFLLVDIRHEPNANDIQMYDWVRASGFTPVIIATKADKLGKSQQLRQIEVIRRTLKAPEAAEILPFSAPSGQGLGEIYRVIQQVI